MLFLVGYKIHIAQKFYIVAVHLSSYFWKSAIVRQGGDMVIFNRLDFIKTSAHIQSIVQHVFAT